MNFKAIYIIITLIAFSFLMSCESTVNETPENKNPKESDSQFSITSVTQNDEYIPLVVILYQHYDLSGVKRYVINDYSLFDANVISFNDETSSITVHKGPDYQTYKNTYGTEPTVTFWEHSYSGGRITLEVGEYRNLSLYNMNDKISSVQFFVHESNIAPLHPENVIEIENIYIIGRLWKHSYSGWHMVVLATDNPIISNINSFYSTFGPGVDNQISSLEITKGPNWSERPNSAFRFWTEDNFGGGYQNYEQGESIGFLYNLNDMFSSSQYIYTPPPPTKEIN